MEAPYVLEYTYKRSTGPVIGRFLGGLRQGRIFGALTRAGRVVVPPAEYDTDGEAITELVEVAQTGSVETWSWVAHPRAGQPLDRPFAYALIRLDGADTAMLHAIDAGSPDKLRKGARVKARFRPQETRTGSVLDIHFFEVIG